MCTDNAGNVNEQKVHIKIDKSPPIISWNVWDGATVKVGDTVSATCNEAGSGIISISGGIFINDTGKTYGNSDYYYGSSYATYSVTFKSTGRKKLYVVCNDIVGNHSYDNYYISTPEITVTVTK